ncbi:hypothetical protein BHE74_00039086 [Ensete ventricosum]|nr:hypothetical protein BHE74_00039086 [Ensete ventricosum]
MRPAFSASILQREERSTPYLELGQQLVGSVCRDDDVAGGGRDESLVHSLVQEGEQRVVVAVNVQQTHLPQAQMMDGVRRKRW